MDVIDFLGNIFFKIMQRGYNSLMKLISLLRKHTLANVYTVEEKKNISFTFHFFWGGWGEVGGIG